MFAGTVSFSLIVEIFSQPRRRFFLRLMSPAFLGRELNLFGELPVILI